MNVDFENLNKITEIVTQINELKKMIQDGRIEKKWLNTDETAFYLGYSKSKIADLTSRDWQEGVHYYKPAGRKIFNKEKLDEWVIGGSDMNTDQIISDVFSGIVK